MSRFTRFSRGKIWFIDIGPCKRFDIFQLCPLLPFEGKRWAQLFCYACFFVVVISISMLARLKCQKIHMFHNLAFLESFDTLTTLNTIKISGISQYPIVGVLSTDVSSRPWLQSLGKTKMSPRRPFSLKIHVWSIFMILKHTHPQQWVHLGGSPGAASFRKICIHVTESGGYYSNSDVISGPKNC